MWQVHWHRVRRRPLPAQQRAADVELGSPTLSVYFGNVQPAFILHQLGVPIRILSASGDLEHEVLAWPWCGPQWGPSHGHTKWGASVPACGSGFAGAQVGGQAPPPGLKARFLASVGSALNAQ
jgi:hypothetical protein